MYLSEPEPFQRLPDCAVVYKPVRHSWPWLVDTRCRTLRKHAQRLPLVGAIAAIGHTCNGDEVADVACFAVSGLWACSVSETKFGPCVLSSAHARCEAEGPAIGAAMRTG